MSNVFEHLSNSRPASAKAAGLMVADGKVVTYRLGGGLLAVSGPSGAPALSINADAVKDAFVKLNAASGQEGIDDLGFLFTLTESADDFPKAITDACAGAAYTLPDGNMTMSPMESLIDLSGGKPIPNDMLTFIGNPVVAYFMKVTVEAVSATAVNVDAESVLSFQSMKDAIKPATTSVAETLARSQLVSVHVEGKHIEKDLKELERVGTLRGTSHPKYGAMMEFQGSPLGVAFEANATRALTSGPDGGPMALEDLLEVVQECERLVNMIPHANPYHPIRFIKFLRLFLDSRPQFIYAAVRAITTLFAGGAADMGLNNVHELYAGLCYHTNQCMVGGKGKAKPTTAKAIDNMCANMNFGDVWPMDTPKPPATTQMETAQMVTYAQQYATQPVYAAPPPAAPVTTPKPADDGSKETNSILKDLLKLSKSSDKSLNEMSKSHVELAKVVEANAQASKDGHKSSLKRMEKLERALAAQQAASAQ
jgi:hypothetical protein